MVCNYRIVIAVCLALPVAFWIYTISNVLDLSSEKRVSHLERVIFEAPRIGVRNIFFIESTCAKTRRLNPSPELSESGIYLSARAACAVEAAARFNPRRPVYLVHTCPIKKEQIWTATKEHVLQALSLPNVRLWPVRLKDVVRDSPARTIYEGPYKKSRWPVEHASDIMRLVILWKYGGTYLDTDVFLVRSLGNMKNFLCSKTPEFLNNAVMDFAFDYVGQSVATECLIDMQNTYNPKIYNYNGPKLVSRVIMRYCNIKQFNTEQDENCHGLNLLTPEYFHPMHLDLWHRFFEEENAEESMKQINKSIGAHVWNHRSHKEEVNLKSKQPFAQIARRVCPNVVSVVPDII